MIKQVLSFLSNKKSFSSSTLSHTVKSHEHGREITIPRKIALLSLLRDSLTYFRFISLNHLHLTDKNELEAAQRFLEQAASHNHPDFLKALSDVLSHPGNSPVSRMAAGLQLKNQLTSKDETVKLKFQANWLQLPEDIRGYIKKNVSNFFPFFDLCV